MKTQNSKLKSQNHSAKVKNFSVLPGSFEI